MEHKLIKMIFFASFVSTAGVVLTQDALGADTVVYAVQAGTQTLGTLDLNTGSFMQISAQAISDSELGVYGGVLYGAGGQCGCLIRINPSTGVSVNAPIPFSNSGNNFGAFNGFGSTTAGLFAVGAGAGSVNGLYSVNTSTGDVTLIGSTGVITQGGTGFLSASNDSSKLYWEVQTNFIDTLYSINTSTGAATLIGMEDESSKKVGNPFSMVFTGGTLWANFWSAGFGTIDTSSGHQTLVSTSIFPAFYGLAPYPLTPVVPPASAARFVPVTPCRVADTRSAAGPFGGPRLPRQTSRDFAIPNSACGIPSTAVAYSMNVAVVPSGPLGFLTLWPTGQPQPLVATLNSIDGRVKSNAATVPAGANGAISVFVTDATDVILDINGYFVPASNASAQAFYPVTPCRVADTRNATAPLGGPSLGAQGTRSFPILASSCGVPASAQAYSLNFAAVPKGPSVGFLTAWPVGQTQPLVASLNDPTGTVLSNAVVVPAGTGGAVNVFTTDATDLVIDINGYFAPPGAGGLSLYTVAPCRVADTRNPAGSPPFNTARDFNVTASPCSIPATAQAFVFNATVVPPGFLGYITMWPQGQQQPLAATLNAYDGAVTNNMAIVPTTTGSVSVFPSAPTHLVLDIFGYFAP
jgi:hypothetical protein